MIKFKLRAGGWRWLSNKHTLTHRQLSVPSVGSGGHNLKFFDFQKFYANSKCRIEMFGGFYTRSFEALGSTHATQAFCLFIRKRVCACDRRECSVAPWFQISFSRESKMRNGKYGVVLNFKLTTTKIHNIYFFFFSFRQSALHRSHSPHEKWQTD